MRGPAWQHVGRFYLLCLALGYLLFQALPGGVEFLGATHAESVLLVVAVINLHHFLVDGFIWKLRRDQNYVVVTGVAASCNVSPGIRSVLCTVALIAENGM